MAAKVANELLRIKAVKLQPNAPFTWASGWKSPIYCDNRKTLSFPDVRKLIAQGLAQGVKEKFADAEVVAGVATGAIAIGMMVAEELGLPFVYVRPKPKEHGLGNQIEGYLPENSKVVVIEDLISTGGSSLKAVDALRETSSTVLGMVAIFTYGFATADENFEAANCKIYTLSNYSELVKLAVNSGYVSESDLEQLTEWRKEPSVWKA
ncbi:MAG: orotate phosphoribosyltransferase [Flavobacteriales bacterium]|nr:orotate phosphoribosyltransferase [Flavobacteriales bacterium]